VVGVRVSGAIRVPSGTLAGDAVSTVERAGVSEPDRGVASGRAVFGGVDFA